MKHFLAILSFAFLFFCSSVFSQNDSRKIYWIFGTSATSSTVWGRTPSQAALDGYKFTNVNDFSYRVALNSPNFDVKNFASNLNQEWSQNGHTNVLGIGHDIGGLVLRFMEQDQDETRLSAMILDGVPNQGAAVFYELLNFGSGKSQAQGMAQKWLDLRSGVANCNDCRVLNAMESFFSDFTTSKAFELFSPLLPNSPRIAELQTVTHQIPFAVIWGNENDDNLTLTRLINSLANAGEVGGLGGADHEYIECFNRLRKKTAMKEKQAFDLALLKHTASISGAVGRFIVSLIPSSPGTPPKIGDAIKAFEDAQKARIDLIKAQKDYEDAIKENRICEIIFQSINIAWNLRVSQNNQVVTETVQGPCLQPLCDDCYITSDDDQVLGYCLSVCVNECEEYVMYPVTYIVYEPHDGLLTRDEQLLAGAAQTYEAKGCNHFQEQFWQYTPIRNAFIDLFNGNAGAAFVVPK